MFDRPKEYKGVGDIFVDFLMFDLRNPRIQEMALLRCYDFLMTKLEKEEDADLFLFDIKFDRSGDCLTIKGDNLISCLWIIGVFPKYPNKLINSYIYTAEDREYIFNTKKKNLIVIDRYGK